jgi:hypothetical protein
MKSKPNPKAFKIFEAELNAKNIKKKIADVFQLKIPQSSKNQTSFISFNESFFNKRLVLNFEFKFDGENCMKLISYSNLKDDSKNNSIYQNCLELFYLSRNERLIYQLKKFLRISLN